MHIVDRSLLRKDGMIIYGCSDEPPNPSNLPQPTDECKVTKRNWFHRDYFCGHRDAWWFHVSMFGVETKRICQTEFCPECWMENEKKHIIFCALCALPIFPSHLVTLYDDDNDGLLPIAHRVGNYVIGCARQDCCYGANIDGYWTGEGFESLFSSNIDW